MKTTLTRFNRLTLYKRMTLTQSGFSLIEVLISIIILSFGLLGMVGLQASAIQSNREARLQSTASGLARELAEMMRSNMLVALGTTVSTNPFLADITSSGTPPAMVHGNPSYCLNTSNTATACANNTEVARAQMTEWLARANTDLPGARVVVCVDSAPFDASGVPQWGCTPGTNATFVVKLGWTRGSTDRSKTGVDALERAVVPSIVYPVTPGNS